MMTTTTSNGDTAMETTTQRCGANWDQFCKKYRIRGIRDVGAGWEVASTSGSTYTVTDHGRVDRETGCLYAVMRCDCPARGKCRHIDAVVDMRYAEAATDGDYDAIERLDRTQL